MTAPASELHLEELQCHFTWNLSSGSHFLLRLRDIILDICPEESNPWRGHIYNLLGFIQARLGNSDKALSLFSSASEVLKGPALLVNYSDLAWFYHERGETTLSQEYVRRVEELSQEYPTAKDHPIERDHPVDPGEEGQHPEVLAEKAWTLMKLSLQQKRAAVDLFERALEEQPQRVEWRSCQAIALLGTQYIKYPAGVDQEVLLKMQRALEEDPENLFLSAECLLQRAKSGEQVKEEVAELMSRIIPSARSSHSGLKIILKYYRFTDAVDEAIFWAEKALEKHPDSRYVKRCTALCYKWRVVFHKDGGLQHHVVEKGVSLLKELISLYPDSGLKKEIDLADFYCKSEPAKTEEMYQTLLQRHLEPPEAQMLYNHYATYIWHNLRDRRQAIRYHQRAARINHESFFKRNSIDALQKLTNSSLDSVMTEIQKSFLSTHLEELQCHFTWDLSYSHVTLLRLRDTLLDICPEESNPWRGHIYNLLGFIQARLGNSDEALSLFSSVSEVFKGPALLVNYSDLAWFYHEREETTLSQEYLRLVEELSQEYPTREDHPSDHREEQLHPEVLAEKAWTLMKLGPQQNRAAVDLFERALEEQPQRVEWRSSQAIALMSAHNHHYTGLDQEVLLKVQRALEEDPENLYLKAEYVLQRAKGGEQVEEEAAELASCIVDRAYSSYSGLKIILRYFRLTEAEDEAIYWAEEALKKHLDSRYVKRCTALCYKWRVLFHKDGASQRHLVERGVSLLKEVISMYPETALKKEIDLADFYGLSEPAKAEEMYQALLQRHLDPPEAQMLYNRYAKFLNYRKHDHVKSTKYHLKAAKISVRSYFRFNSINILQRIRPINEEMRREVNQFLCHLQES